METNRYELKDSVKEKYDKIIKGFIDNIENNNNIITEMNLSDTELNPHTLVLILESLGYEEDDKRENGWQIDFWIKMIKKNKKTLYVKGTAMTFELKLSMDT